MVERLAHGWRWRVVRVIRAHREWLRSVSRSRSSRQGVAVAERFTGFMHGNEGERLRADVAEGSGRGRDELCGGCAYGGVESSFLFLRANETAGTGNARPFSANAAAGPPAGASGVAPAARSGNGADVGSVLYGKASRQR